MDVFSYLLGKKAAGSGGTTDYSELTNKPSINDVELSGNKTTSDLHISYDDLEDKPTIPTYTAGDNISIDANNVISASGGSDYYVITSTTVTQDMLDKVTKRYRAFLNGEPFNVYAEFSQIIYNPYINAKIPAVPLYQSVYNSLSNPKVFYTPLLTCYSSKGNSQCFVRGRITLTVDSNNTVTNITFNITADTILELAGNEEFKSKMNSSFQNYSGYDATKTQVLKNINGTLTWVDEE